MDYREGLVKMICEGGYQWFITLNFNQPRTEWSALGALKKWSARANRVWVGPKWHLKPSQQVQFIACLERAHSNIHFHVLAKNIDSRFRETMNGDVQKAWSTIVRAGSSDVRPISDIDGLAKYVTKELRIVGRDRFLFCLSSEFRVDFDSGDEEEYQRESGARVYGGRSLFSKPFGK